MCRIAGGCDRAVPVGLDQAVARGRDLWKMLSMTDLIIDRFRRVATETPETPFLIHPDGAVLSYDAAWRESARFAILFRSLGI